jgi:hypothetical protein
MAEQKIRIPIIIQDPQLASSTGISRTVEGYDPVRDFFLDGPVSRRVAVVELPVSGRKTRTARYNKGLRRGWYENAKREDLYKLGNKALYTPEFMQVNAFAAVLRTIDLFEKAETLGRPLTWAFDGPQLLVVPRAGEQENAFYSRDTRSLQFFYFPSDKGETVYTCLSRDIVAHETGHAIVDAIAPDLLDACSPHSLALHEALADLTALFVSVSSPTLRQYLLKAGTGSIRGVQPNPFASIAEEFGAALGHSRGLRSLDNDKTLDPKGGENYVGGTEPHALSEVLSGALFSVMSRIHEDLRQAYSKRQEFKGRKDPKFSASGLALIKAAERLKRVAFRALDYVPPGEVSFADYGRAMRAADLVAYPADSRIRDWLADEFKRRGMITDLAELDVKTNIRCPALKGSDVPVLQSSDWAAYDFADNQRDLLGIPKEVPFQVRPRLSVEKMYDKDRKVHECLFWVSWDETEENRLDSRVPANRVVTVGTTVAIDWDTGEILALLTNAKPTEANTGGGRKLRLRQSAYGRQLSDRNRFLEGLLDDGVLRVGKHAIGPDGNLLSADVRAEVSGDVMRVKSSGNMLYLTGGHNG